MINITIPEVLFISDFAKFRELGAYGTVSAGSTVEIEFTVEDDYRIILFGINFEGSDIPNKLRYTINVDGRNIQSDNIRQSNMMVNIPAIVKEKLIVKIENLTSTDQTYDFKGTYLAYLIVKEEEIIKLLFERNKLLSDILEKMDKLNIIIDKLDTIQNTLNEILAALGKIPPKKEYHVFAEAEIG